MTYVRMYCTCVANREDMDRLMDHAYELLKQDSGFAPTLLAYKATATVEEVLGLASVLLESHRVRELVQIRFDAFFWHFVFVFCCSFGRCPLLVFSGVYCWEVRGVKEFVMFRIWKLSSCFFLNGQSANLARRLQE